MSNTECRISKEVQKQPANQSASGTTISWEAWDLKYKPNQDWNHGWGAAPANLLPRFALGAEPLEPGWKTARISPKVGSLKSAKGKVPTRLGSILVEWENAKTFNMKLQLPAGMEAQVDLPKVGAKVLQNGEPVKATIRADRLILDEKVEGTLVLRGSRTSTG